MKAMAKTKFRCGSCNAEFYITVCPVICPLCGSRKIYRGSKKSKETAEKYIQEVNEIIPMIEKAFDELSSLYTRYMTVHETLKTYVARGIIDKNEMPTYILPSLTKAFYESRKKRGTYEDKREL